MSRRRRWWWWEGRGKGKRMWVVGWELAGVT
jgi:hypothetical protein